MRTIGERLERPVTAPVLRSTPAIDQVLDEVWGAETRATLRDTVTYGRVWSCRLLAFSAIGRSIGVVGTCSILWNSIDRAVLVVWGVVACIVQVGLGLTSSAVHVGIANTTLTRRDERLHVLVLVAEALTWSCLGWVVRGADGNASAQGVTIVIAFVASCINVVIQAPVQRMFRVYEAMIALPTLAFLLTSDVAEHRSLSTVVVGWSIVALFLHGRLYAVMVRSTELNMRYSQLLHDLGDANQQLSVQADHDPLTGVANRRGLFEALERIDPQNSAVAFFDLDRFKLVNDSLGHFAGDQLLRAVADRVSALAAPGDLLGRLGGDEFVMILDLENIAGDRRIRVDYVIRRCEGIRAVIAEPLVIEGKTFSVSSSAGAAIGTGRDDNGTALLRHADTAMHRAKEAGRDRVEVFDDSVRERLVRQMDDEEVVRQAMRSGSIVPWYQPIVNAATGRMVSAEVLARWITPEGNTITAEQFISIAAESGQLERLAEVITEQTLIDLATIEQYLPVGFRVAINLPPQYVSKSGRNHRLNALLSAAPHGLLTVEVTERSSPEDLELAADRLQYLRNLGIKVVLDDFGTGHGSLTLLQQLPLDGVKVDRSFISSINTNHRDRALVRGLLAMSHDLGLSIVAEGVETADQCDALMELGCTNQQGYLFGGATDIGGLQDLLVRMPPDPTNAAAVATPPVRRPPRQTLD